MSTKNPDGIVTDGKYEKNMNSNNKALQTKMHMDFFDRTQQGIDNGFYLEAIFREFAAIEGRLEIILGILGAPCNNKAPDNERRNIKISHRIKCLEKIYISNTLIGNTKLDKKFFNQLDKWRSDRNTIVHGFYKNELKYQERSAQNKRMAEDGLELARKLYSEAKRLRRYQSAHKEINLLSIAECHFKVCIQKN